MLYNSGFNESSMRPGVEMSALLLSPFADYKLFSLTLYKAVCEAADTEFVVDI